MVPTEMEDAVGERAAHTRLRLTFRRRDGVALIVSNVVGVGIFTTPAVVAGLVPHPAAILSLWLVGGLLALAGAASYARLAHLWPSAGGEYVYVSKIYGPAAGFLSGWTSLIAGFSGSVAASAIAVAIFGGQYFPALSHDQRLASVNLFGIGVTVTARPATAAGLIAAFALLHICSLRFGKNIQNLLAVLLITMIAAFAVCGFIWGHGSWSHFQSSSLQSSHLQTWQIQSSGLPSGAVHFPASNWLLALIPVMFAYSGWNAAAYVAEEIQANRKSIRPILLGGTAIVILLYVALNVLYLYAVPAGQMSHSANVAETAAQALFGVKSSLITPIIIAALLGAVSAMTIAGPRVYFAMARDGIFIPAFARVSPRFGTPAFAIALQALWSIVLVLLGGFESILLYTGFAIVLSSGAAVAGLFLFRRPGVDPKLKPRELIAPAMFVLASAAMVIDTIWSAPKVALIGVLLILAGLPLYAACRTKRLPQISFQPKEVAAD
jgi:basic amino acid/polyamine antiporter, APA family